MGYGGEKGSVMVNARLLLVLAFLLLAQLLLSGRPTDIQVALAVSTLFPIASPIPTLDQWLGFRDATIDEITAQDADCVVLAEHDTQFQGKSYVAYFVDCLRNDHLLIYRHESRPTLLWHEITPSPGIRPMSEAEVTWGSEPADNSRPAELGWYDINGDGLLELPVGMGNTYYFSAFSFQITIDGQIEELTRRCLLQEPDMVLATFADMNGDGDWEAIAYRVGWNLDTMFSVDLTDVHIYEWDGCAFTDASSNFPDFYQEKIDWLYATHNFAASSVEIRYATAVSALSGLLACDILGRRDECWPLFWDITDLSRHTISPPDTEVQRWLLDLRTLLAQQYEDGLPFTPHPLQALE